MHLQPLTRLKYSDKGDETFEENIQKEETDTKFNSLSELSLLTNKHLIDLIVERLTTILQKCASNSWTKSFIERQKTAYLAYQIVTTRIKEKYRWLIIFRVTNDKAILLKLKQL